MMDRPAGRWQLDLLVTFPTEEKLGLEGDAPQRDGFFRSDSWLCAPGFGCATGRRRSAMSWGEVAAPPLRYSRPRGWSRVRLVPSRPEA
jgi:hypothetical protein